MLKPMLTDCEQLIDKVINLMKHYFKVLVLLIVKIDCWINPTEKQEPKNRKRLLIID